MMIGIGAWTAASIVGVDIADDAVRLLELRAPLRRARGTLPRITAFAQAALPTGTIVNEQLRDPSALVAAIQAARRDGGLHSRRAAIAVPTPLLISRRVELPTGLSDVEYRELLCADAERHLPLPLAEVCFDFDASDAAGGRTADATEIRLFATARSEMDRRCSALQQAGLEARVVDVEAFALELATADLSPATPGAATALLNFNAERSMLLVVQDGQTIYAQQLSGSRPWLNPDGTRKPQGFAQWCEPLRAMLHAAPRQVLIAGACRDPEALAQEIGAVLQLPCAVARLANEHGGTALLAYGLARRGLDAPQ